MNPPQEFAKLIDECADLIDGSNLVVPQQQLLAAEALPSLLERCADKVEQETVRTIHHFACTGGTLISKCVASTPNVQLLSEVAPFSQMRSNNSSAFAPTDLIALLRNGSQGSDEKLELEVFLRGVGAIYQHCARTGTRLVIREHTHSKYCVGDEILKVPGLAKILSAEYEVRSLVSVRHPLDSFLSLIERGWTNFNPPHLDEYARRYLAFLDDHDGCPLVRYEDFVADPDLVMRNICNELELSFRPEFRHAFSVHKLSGDSGRTSATIESRPRRVVPKQVVEQREAKHFVQLCKRLGYDPTVAP